MRIVVLLSLSALIAAGLVARRPVDHRSPESVARAARAGAPTVGYGGAEAGLCGMRPTGLAELAATSLGAVVAEVVGNRCVWSEDRRLIWTETRLRIEESLFGPFEDAVTLREPGGEIPPVGVMVSTAVRYRPGERCIVFLTRDALDQLRTAGVLQGKLPLERDAGGADRVRLDRCLPTVARGHFGEGAPVGLERFRDRVLALRRGDGEGR